MKQRITAWMLVVLGSASLAIALASNIPASQDEGLSAGTAVAAATVRPHPIKPGNPKPI